MDPPPHWLGPVKIERFVWTEHAEMRLGQRRLTAPDVEQAIRDGHVNRQVTMDAQNGW
jgi:hypothetical protein